MKKVFALALVGVFAASSAAMAGEWVKAGKAAGYYGGCGTGAVAQTKAPITTALKSGAITPKPAQTKAPKTGG